MTHSLFPMLQRWYIHVNLVIMKSKWRTTFFVRKKKTCYSLCTSVTEFWSHYIKRQIESLLAKLHSIILQQTIVGLAIEYPDRSAILAGPTNTGSTADVLIFFWREMNPMNMWWRLPSAAPSWLLANVLRFRFCHCKKWIKRISRLFNQWVQFFGRTLSSGQQATNPCKIDPEDDYMAYSGFFCPRCNLYYCLDI